MKSKKRGFCLVINVENFLQKDKRRRGSEVDLQNIHALFDFLGFDVILKKDLTFEQVAYALDEFADLHQNREVEMSAIFMMSHGDIGSVKSPDGVQDHGPFLETKDNRKVFSFTHLSNFTS